LRIKNWDRFQHYRDRKPQWIKLYKDLLDDIEWHRLDGDSAKLLVNLWLLASEAGGELPEVGEIAFRLRLPEKTIKTTITRLSHWLEQSASKPLAGTEQPACLEEEKEEELEEELEKESLSTSSTSVASIFDHWRTAHGHAQAKLDPKRRKAIVSALKSYSEADICQAITGYLNSPHHMGQNERGTKYDDIELMLRDAKHIDAGLRFYREPPRTDLSSLSRRNVAAIIDWQPPELRNAVK
jgi:hypothetical protein